MARLLAYVRTSTIDQLDRLQIDAIKRQSVEPDLIFTEVASGANRDRPVLNELLAQLRAGDVVLVWRFDRLARSTRHLLEIAGLIEARGAHLRSITEGVDTTTPGGRFVFTIFGALGEMERELIRERTNAGLAAAKARGRRGGRKVTFTPDKVAAATRLLQSGISPSEVCLMLNVSRTTLYRHIEVVKIGKI